LVPEQKAELAEYEIDESMKVCFHS
jgi:hypothetical protein